MTKWQLDNQRRYNDYQREIFYLNQNLDEVSIFAYLYRVTIQRL